MNPINELIKKVNALELYTFTSIELRPLSEHAYFNMPERIENYIIVIFRTDHRDDLVLELPVDEKISLKILCETLYTFAKESIIKRKKELKL